MKRLTLLTLVLFVTVVLSSCSYNTMVAKQQNVKGKWANVETNLQSRADLIPNLFEAAKAAGVQEQEVFGQIAAARSQLLNASKVTPTGAEGDKSPEQKQQVLNANESLGSAIGRLLVLTENYPNLKSNENFLKFQDSLEGTERRIKTAREDYNNAVIDYNTTIKQFPGLIEASIFGFKEEPLFKADESSKEAPKISADDLRKNQNK
jgi:LemA protein